MALPALVDAGYSLWCSYMMYIIICNAGLQICEIVCHRWTQINCIYTIPCTRGIFMAGVHNLTMKWRKLSVTSKCCPVVLVHLNRMQCKNPNIILVHTHVFDYVYIYIYEAHIISEQLWLRLRSQ
jgi:hypothetical protein